MRSTEKSEMMAFLGQDPLTFKSCG